MMEYDIYTLISTLGFPIAAYLLLYLDLRKKVVSELEEIKQRLMRIETVVLSKSN